MSVPDARRLLDGSRHVVVSVAQLVGQRLNLVGRGTDCIIQHGKAGWRSHTLPCTNRDKIEFVNVLVSDTLVDNNTWHWVLEVANITIEDPRVHALARVDVHELRLVLPANRGNSRLDLLNLRNTNALHLTLTDTVTVKDNSCRIGSIVLLECFEGVHHTVL